MNDFKYDNFMNDSFIAMQAMDIKNYREFFKYK